MGDETGFLKGRVVGAVTAAHRNPSGYNFSFADPCGESWASQEPSVGSGGWRWSPKLSGHGRVLSWLPLLVRGFLWDPGSS